MNRESGAGRIGFILSALVAAAAIFVAVKVFPVKFQFFEFGDQIEQKLQRATWRSWDQARGDTLKFVRQEAEKTGLPMENFKVQMPAPRNNTMTVIVDWKVPIDLLVTTYVWEYHIEKSAPILGGGGSGF